MRATWTFQPVLGLPIARGRWFTAEEDAPGDSAVAVLSDGLWRRRFGGDPAIVGQTIRLNDRPHLVVGIAAPAATFPKTTDALRRQLLVETATLGMLGGVAGVLVAAAVVPLLARAVAAVSPCTPT